MIGNLSPSLQEELLKLVLAVSEGRGEEVAEVAIRIGQREDRFDAAAFRRAIVDLIAHHEGAAAAQIRLGRALLDFGRVTGVCGIRMPAEADAPQQGDVQPGRDQPPPRPGLRPERVGPPQRRRGSCASGWPAT